MRATIKNYLDAAKQRREENGEKGFSLIELIVVVAILGVLVAIAIPVFISIQGTAEINSLKAAASNGATSAAAMLANNETPTDADLTSLATGDISSVKLVGVQGGVGDVCVRAEGFGDKWAQSGTRPDCTSDSESGGS